MTLPAEWPARLREACRRAGETILSLRGPALSVVAKSDGSPVSAADRAASRILHEALHALAPDIPVVCEEGDHDPGAATRFWLVDPLDGTREFLRGSERFTVNLALIDSRRAVFGMILAPAGGRCWWGGAGLGAFRDGAPIRTRGLAAVPRVLISPAEPLQGPGTLLSLLRARWPAAECVALPGALKFCEVAEGLADLHPRSVPSCGWDSAAGQAILEGAGGAVLDGRGMPLGYAPRQGWRNAAFIAVGDAGRDWTDAFPS